MTTGMARTATKEAPWFVPSSHIKNTTTQAYSPIRLKVIVSRWSVVYAALCALSCIYMFLPHVLINHRPAPSPALNGIAVSSVATAGGVKEKFSNTTILNECAARDDVTQIIRVFGSDTPASAAGNWLKMAHDEADNVYDAEYLKCLGTERQGNCQGSDNFTRSRGVEAGGEAYRWQAKRSQWKVFWPQDMQEIRTLFSDRRVFMFGDSLTRQWQKAMACELKHKVKLQNAADMVIFCNFVGKNKPQAATNTLKKCLKTHNVTKDDFVVINFGHHVFPGKPGINEQSWRMVYKRILEALIQTVKKDFSMLPHSHVIFRTSALRHFHNNKNADWNDPGPSWTKCGRAKANMNARVVDFGGKNPGVMHSQNTEVLLPRLCSEDFGVLDVSAPTLAREDATLDCSHFCLPGPHSTWSRMFYNIMLKTL
jgi:hypothetical protein